MQYEAKQGTSDENHNVQVDVFLKGRGIELTGQVVDLIAISDASSAVVFSCTIYHI